MSVSPRPEATVEENTRDYRVERPSVDYPETPLSGELPIDLPAGARFALVLSHDVDHLGLREHLVDGFLLRYVGGLVRKDLLRRFRPLTLLDRLGGVAQAAFGHDRWDVVPELLEAERRAGVKATWFVAVRRGMGINYGPEALQEALRRIDDAGHDIGLHGQSPDDPASLAGEVEQLSSWLRRPVTGLRMHYLRLSKATLDGMQRGGIRYDSTVFERRLLHPDLHPLGGPRLMRDGLLEIPLHVMDSTLFSATGLGLDAAEARRYCRRLADRAAEKGKALVLNLHPNNYSRQLPEARAWFDALLGDLTSRSDVFVTDFAGLVPRVVLP
jgi:peptidoglycan/xylan/chitin deacetylase (PgdA/CDA1 family)